MTTSPGLQTGQRGVQATAVAEAGQGIDLGAYPQPAVSAMLSIHSTSRLAPPEQVEEFAAQDLVTHDRYGLGRVISAEEGVVLVEFGAVQHRISAPYPKLTKL